MKCRFVEPSPAQKHHWRVNDAELQIMCLAAGRAGSRRSYRSRDDSGQRIVGP